MTRVIAFGMAALLATTASTQTPPAQSWEPYSADLVARATAGDPSAQFALGEAFRTGNGTGPDREQAIAWHRRAAPRDLRSADALGALLFRKGERKEALPLLQAAAIRRNPIALYILGTARFNGDYVPKDLGRAYADMRIAAQTLPQAQRSLAMMEPYVTPLDRTRADQLALLPSGPETGAVTAPDYVTNPPPRPAPVGPKLAPPRLAAAKPRVTKAPTRPPLATTDTVAVPSASTLATTPPIVSTPPASTMPKPAVAKSPSSLSGTWRVQLGAYGSQDIADAQWKRLTTKLPTLAKLQKVTAPAGSGTLVRLQATGIANRDQANALCASAADIGAPCLVLSQ